MNTTCCKCQGEGEVRLEGEEENDQMHTCYHCSGTGKVSIDQAILDAREAVATALAQQIDAKAQESREFDDELYLRAAESGLSVSDYIRIQQIERIMNLSNSILIDINKLPDYIVLAMHETMFPVKQENSHHQDEGPDGAADASDAMPCDFEHDHQEFDDVPF